MQSLNVIPSGENLPSGIVPEGALFFKSTSSPGFPKGLYIYGYIPDNDGVLLGSQQSVGWFPASNSEVDATTLDGFDSTYFQPADADLTALANTSTNGIYVKTGNGSSVTRAIEANSNKIAVTNGDGVSANPKIDVNESNLALNNIGGTLAISKGGTGVTSATQFGVIYGISASQLGFTAAGSNTNVLVQSATGPQFVAQGSLSVGSAVSATNATNATNASYANALSNARTIAINNAVTGAATSFDGSTNITINATALNADYINAGVFSTTGARWSGNAYPISVSGSSASANVLSNARTISLSGGVSGSTSFNGGSNVDISVTVANDSHSHSNYVQKTGDTVSGGLSVTGSLNANGSLHVKDYSTYNAQNEGNIIETGFRGLPVVSSSSALTLTHSHNGKNITSSADIIIPNLATTYGPSNSLSTLGFMVSITNSSSADINITPAAGVSLVVAGTSKVGTQKLAPKGWINIFYQAGAQNSWVVYMTGAGIVNALDGLIVVGEIRVFDRTSVPPLWLAVDGSVKSAAAYPELFAEIGTKYNVGNEGAGNFRLADLRGEFIRGWDNGRGADPGRSQGSYQGTQNASHTHTATSTLSNTLAASTQVSDLNNQGVVSGPGLAFSEAPSTVVTTTIASQGGTEARPRNWAGLICIYAGR